MHLVDVHQYDVIADDVMRQVADVMNRRIVADIAIDYEAVAYAHRHGHVVIGQTKFFKPADTDQPEELAVEDLVRG